MKIITNIQQTLRILWSDDRSIILITIAVGWFFSLGVRMVYPVLLPHIRTTFGMPLSTAGLLLTALWLAYATGQLPAGLLADRVGEGRVMMISSLVSVGTILLVVTAQSVLILFVATILFGLTTALYGVARFTSLSHLYPKHDGSAIGVTMGAGDMGNTLLPPIAAFIATAFVWQYGLGMAVPMFALTAIGLWIFVPAKTSEVRAVDSISIHTIRYIFLEIMQPPILVMTTIQILIYCVWQTLTGLYPTYLIEMKGFHPTTASTLFGFFFALGVVIKPLSGTAYDRFGAQNPLRAMLTVLMFALIALPIVDGFWGVIFVTVPLSGVLGYSAITLTFMTDRLPKDIQNTGLGALRTTYMAVGALSPTLVGFLADLDYFDEAFFLLAGLTLIALIISFRITDNY